MCASGIIWLFHYAIATMQIHLTSLISHTALKPKYGSLASKTSISPSRKHNSRGPHSCTIQSTFLFTPRQRIAYDHKLSTNTSNRQRCRPKVIPDAKY